MKALLWTMFIGNIIVLLGTIYNSFTKSYPYQKTVGVDDVVVSAISSCGMLIWVTILLFGAK